MRMYFSKIALFILLLSSFFIVKAYSIGDISMDGKIDFKDYVILRKYLLKTTSLSAEQKKLADANQDGEITMMDYVVLRKNILASINSNNGKSNNQPVSEKKCYLNSKEGYLWTSSCDDCLLIDGVGEIECNDSGHAMNICNKLYSGNNGKSYVDYSDFKSLKWDNDDYYVINGAHECANAKNKPVKLQETRTYHIYRKSKADTTTINVQTSTDFNNSTIYIHDNIGIDNLSKYSTKSIVNNKDNIFQIIYDYYVPDNDADNFSCIYKSTDNSFDIATSNANYKINDKAGYRVMVVKDQEGEKVWQRVGDNADDGRLKEDIYRVKNGKVVDPLIWNYNGRVVYVTYCRIADTPLEFKNANIITVADSSKNYLINNGSFVRRGILVKRSNVVLSNIYHSYQNAAGNELSEIYYKYQGIFKVVDSADIKISNCKVSSLNAHDSSSYDISLDNVANIVLDKVQMYDDKQLLDNTRWGVMGSNGCKNVTVQNDSRLDRIDAHRGIYNLTVKDSTVGNHGIQVIGSGVDTNNQLILKNVTWVGAKNLITLRHDYGETWNGTITIDNGHVKKTSGTIDVMGLKKYKNTPSLNQPIYKPYVTIKKLTFEEETEDVKRVNIIGVSKDVFDAYYDGTFKKYNGAKRKTSIVGEDKITSTVNSNINVNTYAK